MLDKLNEKDLQKVAEKVFEIKDQADEAGKDRPTDEELKQDDATTQVHEEIEVAYNNED